MINDLPFIPEGFRLLRVLSERPGSWVFLALNPQELHCCLKVQQVAHRDALADVAETRLILQTLTGLPGFIPLQRWGTAAEHSILWEQMALADDLLTLGEFSSSEVENYTPLTLILWSQQNGKTPTPTVIEWGIQLASALNELHMRGLFHRDIKPANLLIFRGQCVLGDYGSMGRTGSSIEFPGTEGYVAPDGLGSPALDIFALGRTLYELWTGLDRFQFPSLPNSVVESQEWETQGWQLNQVLLSAADGRVSQRVPSASALGKALEKAKVGRQQISRRKLLAGIGGILAAGATVYLWKNRPPYKAVWRKIGQRGGYENWVGTELTVDWKRRMIYSLSTDTRFAVLQSVNLTDFVHQESEYPPIKFGFLGTYLDIKTNEMIGVSWTSGGILAYGVDSRESRIIFDGNLDRNEFCGRLYLNPLTHSIGVFGGYGNHHCVNSRFEFSRELNMWKEVKEENGPIPWPRQFRKGNVLFADHERKRWFVMGGLGNDSGKEHEVVAGLKRFEGDFYPLDDLWELDLSTNRWRNLLAPQAWMHTGVKSAVYHLATNSVSILRGSLPGDPQEASIWLQNLIPEQFPIRLPNEGERINGFQIWTFIVDPNTQDFWVFADEGVFSVKLVNA